MSKAHTERKRQKHSNRENSKTFSPPQGLSKVGNGKTLPIFISFVLRPGNRSLLSLPEKTPKGWRRCEQIPRVGFIKTNLRFISPPPSLSLVDKKSTFGKVSPGSREKGRREDIKSFLFATFSSQDTQRYRHGCSSCEQFFK